MIEFKNVSKSYVKDQKVIDNLNLIVNNGEIFGFLGLNGAGKTTTIKMTTGVLGIDEGDILIDENSISKNPIEAKMGFGYVPDSPDMFLQLKGIEYLNFISDIYKISKEDRKERIEKFTKKFGIYENLEQKIQDYSHGMRQKIILSGALIHNPSNWILDEPMTGLDPKSAFELKELMREHAKSGKTVFFSTHVLEVAEKLCDRIGIINNGKLVFVGSYEELKDKYKGKETLEELFLEITE